MSADDEDALNPAALAQRKIELEVSKLENEIDAIVALKRKHQVEAFTIPATALAAVLLAFFSYIEFVSDRTDPGQLPATESIVIDSGSAPIAPSSDGVLVIEQSTPENEPAENKKD